MDNGYQLNYGWTTYFPDLKTENDDVRQRIADYLTEWLSLSFSGFCINTGKHIASYDYAHIFKNLKNNLGVDKFPADFIVYVEFNFSFNERDVVLCEDGEYSVGTKYYEKLQNERGIHSDDINKFKVLAQHYPSNYKICGLDVGRYEPLGEERFVYSIDSHIEQTRNTPVRCINPDEISIYIRDKNKNLHKTIIQKMLSGTLCEINNSKIKLIFSSYSLMSSNWFSWYETYLHKLLW